MKTKRAIEDINRSVPSLTYDTKTMDGWCNRLLREYGYKTLSRLVATAINDSPSPSIDPRVKAWAARISIKVRIADLPFAYLMYLGSRLMQKEFGIDPLIEEAIPSQMDTKVNNPTILFSMMGSKQRADKLAERLSAVHNQEVNAHKFTNL